MNAALLPGLMAVSDTQVLLGVAVGLVALWILFKAMKAVVGLFLKVLIILLVVAGVAWLVWAFQ